MERTARSGRTQTPTRARLALIAAVSALVCLFFYNLYCLTRLRVSEIRVPVDCLPDQLDRLRIAHLSDFHLGQFGTSRRAIARAFSEARRFDPDLVALTGDYIDGSLATSGPDLREWLDFCVPTVAVLGNHDHFHGPAHLDETIQLLEEAGTIVLRNEGIQLCVRGVPIGVIGLDDPFTGRADVDRASAMILDGRPPLLMLAHAPVLAALGDLDRVDLVLCGHTHGGQIRILPSGDVPGKRLLRRMSGERDVWREPDLYRGVHRRGRATIVISDGLGVSLLPLRFRTRPHLVLIELVRR